MLDFKYFVDFKGNFDISNLMPNCPSSPMLAMLVNASTDKIGKHIQPHGVFQFQFSVKMNLPKNQGRPWLAYTDLLFLMLLLSLSHS